MNARPRVDLFDLLRALERFDNAPVLGRTVTIARSGDRLIIADGDKRVGEIRFEAGEAVAVEDEVP